MPLLSESIPNLPLTGSEVMEYAIALIREYAPRYAGVPFKAQLHFTMQNPALLAYDVVAAVSQAEDVTCPDCEGNLPADQSIMCETCVGELKVPNTPRLALGNLLGELRKRMSSDWVFGANLAYPKIKYAIVLSLLVGPEVSASEPHAITHGPKALVTRPGYVGSRELSQRELTGEVSNPNLVRVHYDLPIRQAEKVLPTPEQPMGGLKWGILTFSKGDYPEPVAPVEKNLTPDVAPALEPVTCRLCSEPVITEGLCESHLQEADDKLDEEEVERDRDYSREDAILRDEEEAEAEHQNNERNSGVAESDDSEDLDSEIAEYARARGDLPVEAVIPADPPVEVTPKQRSKRKQ